MLFQLTLLPIFLAASTVLAAPSIIGGTQLIGPGFQVEPFGDKICDDFFRGYKDVPAGAHKKIQTGNVKSLAIDSKFVKPCRQVDIKYFSNDQCTGAVLEEQKIDTPNTDCHVLPAIDHKCAIFSCSKTS